MRLNEAVLENFNFPHRGVSEAFAAAQIILYKASPEWQNYFYSIQKHVEFKPDPAKIVPKKPLMPPAIAASVRKSVRKLAASLPKQRINVDVLVCGVWLWERRQENELLINLLEALLKQQLKVLCLIHKGASVRKQLKLTPDVARRLIFLDPAGVLGRLDARYQLGIARAKARRDFEAARNLLKPHDIYLYESALPEFEWTAARLLEWQAWSPYIEFQTAIVRCHWLPLCSAVAHTAVQRQKKAVTLQQGVVGHSLDIPIVANQLLCFGKSSEKVITDMEEKFFAETGQKRICQDYLRVGSIFDPILELDNFSKRTVLILDQSTRWANHLYSLTEQDAALTQLVTRLSKEGRGINKIIVRPHPANQGTQKWQQISAKFPKICEIYPYSSSFLDDLTRSSITVSIFSGGSVAAAASGLPSFFLATSNGYYTPDLACFESQFMSVESLLDTIELLCTDEQYYAKIQQQCRHAAEAYYENNQFCEFNEPLIDQIVI